MLNQGPHAGPKVEELVAEGGRVPENAPQDDVRPGGEQEAMDNQEVQIVGVGGGGGSNEGARGVDDQGGDRQPDSGAGPAVDADSAWAEHLDLWLRDSKDLRARLTPPAGAPPSKPDSALVASLTMLI